MLNYLYGVKSADIKEIMEALKPQYGGERQFTKARYLDHVMSLEANGLLDLESYSLDEAGELSLRYVITTSALACATRPENFSL